MTIKLDLKDKKILYQLDINSRQSNSEIAKKVGLSKNVVKYRISRLEKSGLIENYYALLNTSKLGFMYCRLFFKFSGMSIEKEKEIADYVLKLPRISWASTFEGTWNFGAVILARNLNELNDTYQNILSKYNDYIINREVSIAIRIHHFCNRFVTNINDETSWVIGGDDFSSQIDETDEKILEVLKENCRTELLKIAKELSLTPKAISYRIKKLVREGFILAFRYKLNHMIAGYSHYHILWYLKNTSTKNKDALINYLKTLPNITYITEAMGSMDLECDMMVTSQNQLHEIIRKIKFDFPDMIKDYNLFLVPDVFRIF